MRITMEEYCVGTDCAYLIAEWNRERNGSLTPNDVAKTGRTTVWWKCEKCGYEWKTQVASRVIGKTGCPECYRNRQSEKHLKK